MTGQDVVSRGVGVSGPRAPSPAVRSLWAPVVLSSADAPSRLLALRQGLVTALVAGEGA